MLKQLHADFCHAIFQKDTDVSKFVSSSHANERLNIYRQNIFENLRNALSVTFPGTWKLLGAECADSAAYAFCSLENMPQSGCLDDWGAAFPAFLQQCKALVGLPYLKDYAQYEWLKHQAYIASPSTAISPTELSTIPPDSIEEVHFSFIPSFALYTSNYPIAQIDEIAHNTNASEISLTTDKVYAIIARPGAEVVTLWISYDSWVFAAKLYQGNPLGDAVKAAQSASETFDIVTTLQFLLKAHVISNIQI